MTQPVEELVGEPAKRPRSAFRLHPMQAATGTAASDTIRLHTRFGEVRRLDIEVIEGRRPIHEFGRDTRQLDLEAVVDELLASAGDRVAETEDRGLATLVGTVRAAEDGRPVAGARVRLLERREERVTGSDGAFAITGLPRGRYRVVTEYLGLASDTADVDLRLGTGQVAVFTLRRGRSSSPRWRSRSSAPSATTGSRGSTSAWSGGWATSSPGPTWKRAT